MNSFNFDFKTIRKFKKRGIRVVHRIDGPISLYRGRDFEIDRQISEINQEIASATVFQSHYSQKGYEGLGLVFRNPTVIHNAVDPSIFYPDKMPTLNFSDRKLRIIATAWSNNPKKGLAAYRWLDQNLNFERYEMTFVGRVDTEFKNIRLISPQPSKELAAILREHDVYITASENDSCSNALLEGLSCGLPAVYHDSGGSPELVKGAGVSFLKPEEIPGCFDKISENYSLFQKNIKISSLKTVADQYIEQFNLL